MSDTAKSLGVQEVRYEYGGVSYTLSAHDLEDYARYEMFLEETGWAALKRARQLEFITEPEYKESLREFLSLLATHQLSFGTPDYVKSTNTLPGVKKMLELSLAHNHTEFKRDNFGHLPAEKLLHDMTMKDMPAILEALGRL